ncbi:MAG TPA: rhomboid family intramembrane serine protease [Candidatus Polarisedimenticolia bacterium]|nr:rhomboid family intramembrane serine protease [Candidatus Polarisedimenticolia bacterium]
MIPLKDDNPTLTTPFVTVGLVILNVAAFLYQMSLPEQARVEMIMRLGVIPAAFTTDQSVHAGVPLPLTLFTSMFLHGGWMHLLGNMLYLWIFGNNIEDVVGHIGFVLFYLLCGLAAVGTQIAAGPDSSLPMIGASGAIAGVLGAYMLLFPRARVLTIVPIFIFIRMMYLPAFILLGLWFVYQILLSGAEDPIGGGVAFFAHIGGFVAGMLLIWVFRKTPRPRAQWDGRLT